MTSIAPWTIARRGRLLLARWNSLADVAAAQAYRADIFAAMQSDPSSVVICADWRSGSLLSPDAAEVLLGMLTGRSTQIERSAILLAANKAVFDLQVERLVREANHPSRRTFRDADKQMAYLGEVLSASERELARSFLMQLS
jgi:hypothetical protein